MQTIVDDRSSAEQSYVYDAVVVGAGFAGLYMLHRLRETGFTVMLVDAAPDVGGTWYWNRYPGARCDVESLLYCYTFAPQIDEEWTWSERYATQPEILRYLRFCAEKLDLRRDIRFSERVTSAIWDEHASLWTVDTDRSTPVRTRFCVMASGCLSSSRPPAIPGIADFAGTTYHTSAWPTDPVDLTGKRVAIIGTGSSGIQAIPCLAAMADRLIVFQRTANYSAPAKNAPLTGAQIQEFKNGASALRARARTGEITGSGDVMISEDLRTTRSKSIKEFSSAAQHEVLERRWNAGGALIAGSFKDLLIDEEANEVAAKFVQQKIRDLVTNPDTARRLTPSGYPFAAKRLCVDTDYYVTFNRSNVDLVDIKRSPIARITRTGIQTSDADYDVDVIVFATGFDAFTGALFGIDIRGRDGLLLQTAWATGPKSYLGLAVSGFPNFFTITGPGSPSVLSNVVISIEQHVEFIADCLAYMRANGRIHIEADPGAQESWVAHVNDVAAATLFVKANSWYLGANIPGKPRVFMPYVGGVGRYRQICNDVAAENYKGFTLRSSSGTDA